jgi:hypothetical protein
MSTLPSSNDRADDAPIEDWHTYSEGLVGDLEPGGAPLAETSLLVPIPDPIATTALIQVNPQADSKVAALYREATALLAEAEALVITVETGLRPSTDRLVMIKGLKTALE